MKLFVVLVVTTLCISQSLGQKENSSNKKSSFGKEKDKLVQWTNVQKKSNSDKHVKDVKTRTKTHQTEEVQIQMHHDHQERARICEAMFEESAPDFFLKFGLVTGLIRDVGEFQTKIKAQDPVWRKKRLRQNRKEQDKFMAMKQKTMHGNKPFKSNHLREKVRARNEGNSHMPPCYGFNYLVAMDVLSPDEKGFLLPNVEAMRELMADMNDMKLLNQIVGALEQCQKKTLNDTEGCPSNLSISSTSCNNMCISDTDCATNELCCRTTCGGTHCIDSRFKDKYRSEEEGDSGIKKCQGADRFMHCAYHLVKEQVCD